MRETSTHPKSEFSVLLSSFESELGKILEWWLNFGLDRKFGGFNGRVNNENTVSPQAEKGSVLNARILWAFSAAFRHKADARYLDCATRAYAYIEQHFLDPEFGGVFWTVDYLGNPLDTKKQVYACAFTIYGLTEYYAASKLEKAKEQAIALYRLLIRYAYDPLKKGYWEAFAQDWQELNDQRLSEKDINEKKTMNTHLHVLEAYRNLYLIWPDQELKEQIETLIDCFSDHFIHKSDSHLTLFFNESWEARSETRSYGHDIEASWLLLDAAEGIGDIPRIAEMQKSALKLAGAAKEGMDSDGGMWYEYEPSSQHLVAEKHWWVQAEAMVGFLNAWMLSGNEYYFGLFKMNWDFVKSHILDKRKGEWFWGVGRKGKPMPGEDKAGLWKCPYHNTRACLEVIRRLSA